MDLGYEEEVNPDIEGQEKEKENHEESQEKSNLEVDDKEYDENGNPI